MYRLDTDHLSILDRGGADALSLQRKLKAVGRSNQIATSIISYEEQVRGLLDLIRRAKSPEKEVAVYRRLKRQLSAYCDAQVLDFDQAAAQKFEALKKRYRIGTMDLKIASIALANKAIVLTRNTRDFGQIAGLTVEDWT